MRVATLAQHARITFALSMLLNGCGDGGSSNAPAAHDASVPESEDSDESEDIDAALDEPSEMEDPVDASEQELADGLESMTVDAQHADADASPDAGDTFALPAHCASAASPPGTLECTGLYADLSTKRLAPGVRAYTPAYALWSDASQKQRWVWLPDGSRIDGTNPNEWTFPVGTKFFKEFSVKGKRVETRMWHKLGANFWVNATYAWSDDETAAARHAGGDVQVDGDTYYIPTLDECEKCHRGRTEHILGFDAVLLGLSGAAGVTLADLAAEHLLDPAPERTRLTLGDDPAGLSAAALGWLHANCGITCHNGNSRATAYPTGMRLRLDASALDGRPAATFESYTTTVGVGVTTASWMGRTRIAPGDPENSFLYELITTRGTAAAQMPPMATRVVDSVNAAIVAAWIQQMLAPASSDAGTTDAGVDADAGPRGPRDGGSSPDATSQPSDGGLSGATDADPMLDGGTEHEGGQTGSDPDATNEAPVDV